MMRDLQGIKKIVIKVGSSSLCNQKGQIEKEKILLKQFVQQLHMLSRFKSMIFIFNTLMKNIFLSLIHIFLIFNRNEGIDTTNTHFHKSIPISIEADWMLIKIKNSRHICILIRPVSYTHLMCIRDRAISAAS